MGETRGDQGLPRFQEPLQSTPHATAGTKSHPSPSPSRDHAQSTTLGSAPRERKAWTGKDHPAASVAGLSRSFNGSVSWTDA